MPDPIIYSSGDYNLRAVREPYIRFVWEASDGLYIAGFLSKDNAMEYGRFKGWVK
jgi:hypothetical protein